MWQDPTSLFNHSPQHCWSSQEADHDRSRCQFAWGCSPDFSKPFNHKQLCRCTYLTDSFQTSHWIGSFNHLWVYLYGESKSIFFSGGFAAVVCWMMIFFLYIWGRHFNWWRILICWRNLHFVISKLSWNKWLCRSISFEDVKKSIRFYGRLES